MKNVVTRADLAHRRLLNHHIAGERFGHPAGVVRWMGAMQAQDYQQALWAIGLRMTSATAAEIEQAFAGRTIVRTWPLRGTMHLVAAEDAKWMVELLAPRRLAGDGLRLKQLELDERTIGRRGQLFHDALRGGKQLSRSAMMTLLEDAQISTAGQRGYHILWYLAQTGLICLGPMQGKEQTSVLLDEWAPAARRFSREEALAELAGRYFASHGPATVADFANWAGLTLADARAGLASAKRDLVSEARGGKDYWLANDAPDRVLHDESSVYLLPGFDEYLLGYKDRGDVLAAEHASKVVPRRQWCVLPDDCGRRPGRGHLETDPQEERGRRHAAPLHAACRLAGARCRRRGAVRRFCRLAARVGRSRRRVTCGQDRGRQDAGATED